MRKCGRTFFSRTKGFSAPKRSFWASSQNFCKPLIGRYSFEKKNL